MITFTHDRSLDIMLPGVPPTGRRIAVAVVVVVGFENGMVSHEHIYWDQATVLVQAGPARPPVACPSSEPSRPTALLDQEQPKNEIFERGA